MKPVSKEEFMAILERRQKSGFSIKDFCANESYTVSSFHYWKTKFGLIRPIALSRKNFMFCGNHEAAGNTAIICSLLTSCKEQGVNPREWLIDLLENPQLLE